MFYFFESNNEIDFRTLNVKDDYKYLLFIKSVVNY